MTHIQRDEVAGEIIGAAIDVHRQLGPGLLESVYEPCLEYELIKRGLRVERQVPMPVTYRGTTIDCSYRLDLLVDRDVIVEIKSVEQLLPIHDAQVLTYLRLSGARQALLFKLQLPSTDRRPSELSWSRELRSRCDRWTRGLWVASSSSRKPRAHTTSLV